MSQNHGMEHMIWREFRFLPVFGGTYGFFHTKLWAAASIVNYTAMYTAMVVVESLLFYTVYLLLGHLSYMSQAIHFAIVGLVVMAASITLTFNRKKVETFELIYTDPLSLCEYPRDEYFEELMKTTTRKKRKLIITWILLYGLCALIGLNQPIIDNFFEATSDVTNVNGAWLNLPIIMWWPVDTTTSYDAWLTAFILQGVYIAYAVIMVISGVVVCFATADRLIAQVKLIIHSVNTLDKRAKDMFRQRFPGSHRKYMEKEYEDCYYECIKQNVKHHLEIIAWVERFMDMASIPVAVPFFGGAILLGMALITITEEDDPRVGPKCLAASVAFAEAYNMYLLCDTGQQFQQLSQDLYDALYFSRWTERSDRVKKAIHIMRSGCMQPIKFTAAKLLVLNMELFADLVNSAYSIFNLKATVSKDKEA